MRSAIHKVSSISPFLGCLPPGCTPINLPIESTDYHEFLAITNGAICGEAVFYSVTELTSQQWIADHFDGGSARWFVVGRIDLWEILIERSGGQVQLGQITADAPMGGPSFVRFDELLRVLFSSTAYQTLNHGSQDDWFAMLASLGFE